MNKSSIEWCTHVWNPITGCTHVSLGCEKCYASAIAKRFWGERKFSDVRCHPERLLQSFPKKPARIFLNSMGDLFHPLVPTTFIDDVLEVIAAHPEHTFIVLTKRPELIDEKLYGSTVGNAHRCLGGGDYLPNLWLGVSVEDQRTADIRISILLQTLAAKRIISIEPMLEEVKLRSIWNDYLEGWDSNIDSDREPYQYQTEKIDWVICGRETGSGARPFNLDWARSARDQCVSASVPFFYKNGLLDGVEWHQFPGVQS